MAKTIAVSILADTKELAANLSKAEGNLKGFGDTADREASSARRSLDSVAEGADHTASASAQAAGGLGDLGGALQLMGGPLAGVGAAMEAAAPAIMGVTGAADLMNFATEKLNITTLKNTVTTTAKTVADKAAAAATKAFAIAQRVLNAVMAGSPIALVVIAIMALVAAFILAYKKSATFRHIVQGAMNGAKNAAKAFVNFFRKTVPAAFSAVVKFIGSKWKAVTGFLSKPMSAAVSFIKNRVSDVKNAIGGMVTFVKNLGSKFLSAGKTIGSKIIDGIKSGLSAVGGVAASLASSVGHALVGIINSLISKMNSAIPNKLGWGKFAIDLPDSPIPQIALAQGGIVNRPTVALIGEAGPEAVVPLNKGGLGTHITLQFHGPVLGTKEAIGKFVSDALNDYNATGGVRWA